MITAPSHFALPISLLKVMAWVTGSSGTINVGMYQADMGKGMRMLRFRERIDMRKAR